MHIIPAGGWSSDVFGQNDKYESLCLVSSEALSLTTWTSSSPCHSMVSATAFMLGSLHEQ
jgi:hypothetical protein